MTTALKLINMPCPALTPPTQARAGIVPRRKPYQGPPTAVPTDPRQDRRISSSTAAVELWLAEHTASRWIAWHEDETIGRGISRSRRTVQHHLSKLKAVGRIEVADGIRNLKTWIRVHGGRYGLTDADIPRSYPKASRAIILRRRLTLAPGYTEDSIGSIPGLVADDEIEPSLAVHAIAMDCDSERAVSEVHALAISDEVDSQSFAASNLDSDCISKSETSLRGDDERSADLESEDPELASWLKLPATHVLHNAARQAIRLKANPPPPTPCRSVAPPPPPTPVVSTPIVANRSTGRINAPRAETANRIVETVASGDLTPEVGARQLAELVQDTNGLTLTTYRNGLLALADGRATLDEVRALVRDASNPGVHSPNRILSSGLGAFARRVKNPSPVNLPQFPATGSLKQ